MEDRAMSFKRQDKKLAGARVQVLFMPDHSIAFDLGSFGVIIERVPNAQGTKLVDVPRVFFDKEDDQRYTELFFDHWEEFCDQGICWDVSMDVVAFKTTEKIFSRYEYLPDRRLIRVMKEHFKSPMKAYCQRSI